MKESMKTITLILLISLAAVVCRGEGKKKVNRLPEPIIAGLEAYSKDGCNAAVDVWLKNSVMDRVPGARGQLAQIAQVEEFYGRYEGYELVRDSMLTPRLVRYYLAIYYERGPLWVYFDIYEKKDGSFLITEVQFNTKANLILPSDFFR
jgi:hypothetical protein